MLDQLFDLIQNNAKGTIIDNKAIPNEHNEAVMQVAQTAIINGLGSLFNQGQISALSDIIKGGAPESNSAVKQISDNFMGSIVEKFGINSDSASSIASELIPLVINKMLSKTQPEGGGSFDLSSMLDGFGLNKDGDGNVGR